MAVASMCVTAVLMAGSPPAGAATTSISGVVTKPGGIAASGYLVVALVLATGGEIGTLSTTTHADGSYTLSIPPAQASIVWTIPGAPDQMWAITYYGNTVEMDEATVLGPNPSHTGIDIEVVRGGTVTGTVTMAGGTVPEQPTVDFDGRGGPVEPDGSYVAEGVAPGPRLGRFQRNVGMTTWRAVEFGLVEVQPDGISTLDMEFPEHISPLVPVDPDRLVDTRAGRPQGAVSVPKQRIGGSKILEVDLWDAVDAWALPPDLLGGLAAVSLNVTATGSSAEGYLTVYPCGTKRPTVSSVNFAKGQTAANAVVAPLDGPFESVGGSEVCIYSSAPVDVIIDTNGWFPSLVGFTSTTPTRVVDTRAGKPQGTRSVSKAKVGPTDVVRVDLTGTAGIPASGVAAASMNLTVTGANGPGYLTAYPCATVAAPRPASSSVNFGRGVVANAAVAPLAGDGGLCLYASTPVDVILDTNGWLAGDTGFASVAGQRLADTRAGKAPASTTKGPIGPKKVLTVPTGTTALAASLNVTVTNPASNGYVTVYPCDLPRPGSSNVNFVKGQTVANLALSPLSETGDVCVSSSASADVVVDLNGTFDGSLVTYF